MSLISAGVLLCLITIGCDEDCPTCPDPAENIEKHYPLYAYIGWPEVAGYMSMIDAPADTILDTVETAMVPYSLTLNVDHSKIVVPSTAARSVLVYDVETLRLDTTFDFYADFYFDRRRGIGVRTSENSLAKVDGVTLEVLASMETPSYEQARIDTTNGIIYAIPVGQSNTVHRIDYVNMTVVDTLVIQDQFDNAIAIHRPLPIAAHDRLYFTGRPWGHCSGGSMCMIL